MNLGDPELEMIDPTPNVHSLFIHFDKMFFWTKLASRAVVRWSKRMYSCAGVCSYEGSCGLCDIALSEPLLKLRPRKDLIETLLHEMIHAFLFVTNRDQDRDGHGPNFQAHMHRINKCAGLNISIYHSFHDEVHLYQTHWWRCNGPCQKRRPHFGIVRRSTNRAPGPSDYWWNNHLSRCGGKFIKIKEPQKEQKSKDKKNTTPKPNADITRYITNNIKTINNVPHSNNSTKPVLKDSTNVTANTKTTTNSASTEVISKKGKITAPKQPIPVFTGSGNKLNTGSKPFTVGVAETVRMIWANKQITTMEPVKKVDPSLKKPIKNKETGTFKEPGRGVAASTLKHKTESTDLQSPPTKMRKIEDYFNATTILKDIYGDDYKLTQSKNNKKLVAVNVKVELVDCPICSGRFSNEEINRHLDECLNKDIIEKLIEDGIKTVQETSPLPDTQTANKPKPKEIIDVPPITAFKTKAELTPLPENNNNDRDLTNMIFASSNIKSEKPDIITPKAALPLVPENNNNNVIDLTQLNFDINNINTLKTKPKETNSPVQEEIQLCFLPVPAFKPIPSLPENTDNDLIDLTHLDFDTSIIKKVDKGKRKTESEATLQSEPFIKKVVSLRNEMDEQLEAYCNERGNPVSLITLDRGDVVGEEAEEVEVKAGPSNEEVFGQRCPCCGIRFEKPVQEHLDECLMFFNNNYKHTIPEEGASTSFSNHNNTSISKEDEEDDICDESQELNETGTKTPCPCCMKMVEQDDMNEHLDMCLLL